MKMKNELKRHTSLRHMVVEDNDELFACYHNSVHKEKKYCTEVVNNNTIYIYRLIHTAKL